MTAEQKKERIEKSAENLVESLILLSTTMRKIKENESDEKKKKGFSFFGSGKKKKGKKKKKVEEKEEISTPEKNEEDVLVGFTDLGDESIDEIDGEDLFEEEEGDVLSKKKGKMDAGKLMIGGVAIVVIGLMAFSAYRNNMKHGENKTKGIISTVTASTPVEVNMAQKEEKAEDLFDQKKIKQISKEKENKKPPLLDRSKIKETSVAIAEKVETSTVIEKDALKKSVEPSKVKTDTSKTEQADAKTHHNAVSISKMKDFKKYKNLFSSCNPKDKTFVFDGKKYHKGERLYKYDIADVTGRGIRIYDKANDFYYTIRLGNRRKK